MWRGSGSRFVATAPLFAFFCHFLPHFATFCHICVSHCAKHAAAKNGGVRRYAFSNATKQHVDSTVYYYDVEQSTATGELEFLKSWAASEDLFHATPKQPIEPSDMLDLALSWRIYSTY